MSTIHLDDARQYVLRMAKENDVRFIRLWFTDILGNLKGFAITVAELEGALEHGMAFDGSSVEGFARRDESDMVAMPDPTTFSVLPWRPRQNAVARMFCDVLRPTGEPFEGDPRYVLKLGLERTAKLGYSFQVGPEIEHFYFKGAEEPVPLDLGGYFDLTTPLDSASDLRRETVLALEEMGIPVEYSHHEVASSQHEIDLRHTDALTMADAVMTYRQVVKEVAMRHGVYATFMPKPREDQNGNGMHVNLSLSRGEENAFYDSEGEYRLSKTALQFIAGLLRQLLQCCRILGAGGKLHLVGYRRD
jgi:glutamine synthetase